jgi:hypothetical protein
MCWPASNALTCSVQIPAGISATLTEIFYGFVQFLKANAGIIIRLGHYRFLKNSLEIVSHLIIPSKRYSLDTESIIK